MKRATADRAAARVNNRQLDSTLTRHAAWDPPIEPDSTGIALALFQARGLQMDGRLNV